MKIVFMGTPDFSLEPLNALVKAGHNVSLVLTREDKKRNRGELSPTPVKELATKLNIPVLTPTKMRDKALIERLKSERFYRKKYLIFQGLDVSIFMLHFCRNIGELHLYNGVF